jgi:hypothetical protein
MSKSTPLDRVTATLEDLRKLQRARDLLHRVALYLPARKYGLVIYARKEDYPDGLTSLVDALDYAITMHERLGDLYRESGPYEYPEGYIVTPESEKLWRQIQDYFGFDDSE